MEDEGEDEAFAAKVVYLDGKHERVLRGTVTKIDPNFVHVTEDATGKPFKIGTQQVIKIEGNGQAIKGGR